MIANIKKKKKKKGNLITVETTRILILICNISDSSAYEQDQFNSDSFIRFLHIYNATSRRILQAQLIAVRDGLRSPAAVGVKRGIVTSKFKRYHDSRWKPQKSQSPCQDHVLRSPIKDEESAKDSWRFAIKAFRVRGRGVSPSGH